MVFISAFAAIFVYIHKVVFSCGCLISRYLLISLKQTNFWDNRINLLLLLFLLRDSVLLFVMNKIKIVDNSKLLFIIIINIYSYINTTASGGDI